LKARCRAPEYFDEFETRGERPLDGAGCAPLQLGELVVGAASEPAPLCAAQRIDTNRAFAVGPLYRATVCGLPRFPTANRSRSVVT